MKNTARLLVCFAAFLCGCSTPQPVAVVSEQVPVPAPEPPPYVAQVNTFESATPSATPSNVAYRQVILDGIGAENVVVKEIRRSKTNDGFERIQVFIKNMTTLPMRVRWRFDWQDANGVVVDDLDNSGWEKSQILPGDDGVFTSIAPRKDCADFRLRMKQMQ